MKKKKLKKWVKVALTITIIVSGIIAYNLTDVLGGVVMKNSLYLVLCLLDWGWVLVGQMLTIDLIWR